MKSKYFLGLMTFLALSQGLFATAHADPVVTFQVPLKLENLPPEITKARVTCYLLKKDDYVIAVKFTDAPISGGQYLGPPVAVAVDLTMRAYAADAVGWKCTLKLVASNGGEGVPAYNASTTMFKAKDGTPLTIATQGRF